MQLTNFLRDVREDYEQLGRIYIPSDILKKYGLSHDDIPRYIHNTQSADIMDEIKKTSRTMAMKEMISHCRIMYSHSLDGLQYLNPE
jgi:phytoene/squalene synthetase